VSAWLFGWKEESVGDNIPIAGAVTIVWADVVVAVDRGRARIGVETASNTMCARGTSLRDTCMSMTIVAMKRFMPRMIGLNGACGGALGIVKEHRIHAGWSI